MTARLYGGGRRCRLKQEIALGIGGLRALERLGVRPTIRHINEGHAAFVSLEKIRQLVSEEGLSFDEAREVAAAGNVFTTHTPVPAGIDVFSPELLWKFFAGYVDELGITFEQFFELGQEGHGHFSMAVLAMRLSTHKNAVSKLHARVSRGLWRDVTPDLTLSEVPIRPITNGVHLPTWTAPEIAALSVLERPEGWTAPSSGAATRRSGPAWSPWRGSGSSRRAWARGRATIKSTRQGGRWIPRP